MTRVVPRVVRQHREDPLLNVVCAKFSFEPNVLPTPLGNSNRDVEPWRDRWDVLTGATQ